MRDGEAFFVVGSRGSGKTAWVRQQVRRHKRLLVWDAVQEWSREGIVSPAMTMQQLQALILADIRRPGEFRVGYAGPLFTMDARGRRRSMFDPFCVMAWAWMRRKPGTLIVEELSDVTQPGKAPAAWGEIVRKGRHSGSAIYALTQRPAESDKTIAGNIDVLHCGRLAYPRDRRTLAEYLDVPVGEVTALQNLDYIERDLRNHQLRRGRLEFK